MSNKISVSIDIELKELIPHFLESRTKDVINLTTLITNGDFKAIESIAHKLSGNAGSYGFMPLGEVGKRMETAAKAKQLDAIKVEFEKMKDYLNNIEITYVTL